MDRAAVFIDGGYLDKVLEYFGRPRIDYAAFSDILCGNLERYKTFYYHAPPYQGNPPTDEEKQKVGSFDRFIYNLNNLPRFQIRLGKLSCFTKKCKKCGDTQKDFEQKRVDNLLTVDTTRMIWKDQIFKAILVTGDSDFVPVVEEANNANVLVHVFYHKSPKPNDPKYNKDLPQTSIHDELYGLCDERTQITEKMLKSVLRK